MKIEAEAGMNIFKAIIFAQKTLINLGYDKGYLVFNGLEIPLSIGSLSSDIARIYDLMFDLRKLTK